MSRFKSLLSLLVVAIGLGTFSVANADLPEVREDGVAVVHLDEYNGYFAAEETLASLKAGTYEFIITNKSGKLVGFQIQNFETHEQLDMFPLEPGETRSSIVTVTEQGVRYRCPINVTPWYDLDNIKTSST